VASAGLKKAELFIFTYIVKLLNQLSSVILHGVLYCEKGGFLLYFSQLLGLEAIKRPLQFSKFLKAELEYVKTVKR